MAVEWTFHISPGWYEPQTTTSSYVDMYGQSLMSVGCLFARVQYLKIVITCPKRDSKKLAVHSSCTRSNRFKEPQHLFFSMPFICLLEDVSLYKGCVPRVKVTYHV